MHVRDSYLEYLEHCMRHKYVTEMIYDDEWMTRMAERFSIPIATVPYVLVRLPPPEEC